MDNNINSLITNNRKCQWTYKILWWHYFLPIFGEALPTQENKLLELSIRDGGLVIEELTIKAPIEYEISQKVTKSLVTAVIEQGTKITEKEEQQTLISGTKIKKVRELQK